jgi:thiosulfate dehydrogenase
MKRITLSIFYFLAGLFLFPAIIYCYLLFGKPPVATADAALPLEAKIAHTAMKARIKREMPVGSPITAGDDNLVAGAEIYKDKCAQCHGTVMKSSPLAKNMFPRIPQLWVKHKNGVVGVSDDPIGETYWKVKNGIRLSGMPAFGTVLSDTQMWQVSVLLSKADKPLPLEASKLLQ